MRPRSYESSLLRKAELHLEQASRKVSTKFEMEARLQLLEAAASRIGGYPLSGFQESFGIKPLIEPTRLSELSEGVVRELAQTAIHPSMGISALAREALSLDRRRAVGQFYTDFRLASHVARGLESKLAKGCRIVDPACGTGILLTAASLVACGADRRLAAEWLASSVFASDLSDLALRGARAALSCLTDDLFALETMYSHWKRHDSLLEWEGAWEAESFDVVVANPPWEKMKLSRHEFLKEEGQARHYGDDYGDFDPAHYNGRKSVVASYADRVAQKYEVLREGEADLYVAFSELACRLAKKGGSIGIILPAGLIRSKNTEALRRLIWSECSDINIEVFENRGRFFEIDSRFKFAVCRLEKKLPGDRSGPIALAFGGVSENRISTSQPVRLGRITLTEMRPDLTIPEVATDADWKLFGRMSRRGVDWADPSCSWYPKFMREVDMTRDRSLFLNRSSARSVPLIEGRMVHHFRVGAKTYKSGRGRAAVWEANNFGSSEIGPQFWIDPERLTPAVRDRVNRYRVGFCDITGQTNERSCMSAIIPPGSACGNKVPTILFPNDPQEDRLWLWMAISNSLAFDWLLRRVITTTVNYFLLTSVRLPLLEPDSLPGRRLIAIAKDITRLDTAGSSFESLWNVALLRAKADHIVATAYGLDVDDMRLILGDFPLLDRRQDPLPGEKRSTVTADLLMSQFGGSACSLMLSNRIDEARRIGAVAYMPAQYSYEASETSEVSCS
jgi:methylase of polypeptide subunit release factors